MTKKPAKRKKRKHFIASEEQIGIIIDMGAFEYPINKMVLVLQLDDDQSLLFKETAVDTTSDVHKAIQMGKSQIDYAIDSKLLAMIRAGDLKALEEFQMRIHERKNS